jgi:uncharacterized protein with ATP-grasp and redox domains
MRAHLECIPCFIKQSLEAARMVTDDKEIQTKVLKEVMQHLQNISLTNSPPELSREVHGIIRKITRSKDPYEKVKEKSNKMARKDYLYLKKVVNESDDPLLMAIKLSIVGNVIDFGTTNRFNVNDMIDNAINKDFDASSYLYFKRILEKSVTILYLADNSGEIFFDKILLEELVKKQKKITYVVKANPIINDALIEDAKYAGIDQIATIVEGDSEQKLSSPGMLLSFASENFMKIFKSSDIVLSKGQGNYEGLSNVDREVFFMLVVKCPLVARDINSELGKLIFKVNK